MRIIGGPLLRVDETTLPDRLCRDGADFEELATSAEKYIAAVIHRYRGRVHLWHASAGTNLPGGLSLDDEQRLRLTVLAIESVRRADPRTPVIISFDQPWAEYLVDEQSELPPLHFADMLVRADIGLAGIGLEMNLGYWPGGSLLRDALEVGQLVDQWSVLGLPLLVMLCAPGGSGSDPLAERSSAQPFPSSNGQYTSAEHQRDLTNTLIPMLVAKQSVHGVSWNQVFDSQAHRFPHGGLFDARGRPKPSLSGIISLRGHHLQ
jgi:hypothetical protein